MEQITINITGQKAQEQTAQLMTAIYKTMARINDKGCHITISSQSIDIPGEKRELQVPDFMKVLRQLPMAGRIG